MKLYCHVVVVFIVVVTTLTKENSSVPAIRPLSQRGIIFPVENWDDCFLDEASTKPGVCKSLEQCPEVLEKWDKENVYPKTCYFIKAEQFVCCPPVTNTVTKPSGDHLTFTENPLDLKKETATQKPSNIFLDNLNTINETATKRPSNIFLDNVNTDHDTTRNPLNNIPNIFITEASLNVKRKSEIECELVYQQKFENDNDGQPLKPNGFPFMAALGWKSSSNNKIWYPCSGVLISTRFVLTAAHCADIGGETPSLVHLGDDYLTQSEEGTIKIRRFIKHSGYNATTIYNDIALVELEEEVNNTIACLWYEHNIPITRLTALAYDYTPFSGLVSNSLLTASLTVIGKDECKKLYEFSENLNEIDIVDDHLCAGDAKYLHNSCQGNTGGPLIMELDKIPYVVGITTFDMGCAGLPPSIYTRVSSYIEWIEQIVSPEIDIRLNES